MFFSSEAFRRITLAMCWNANFSGSFAETPKFFSQPNIKQVRIVRNGAPILNMDTDTITRAYYKTVEGLHFDRHGLLITLENSQNHFYLVFGF